MKNLDLRDLLGKKVECTLTGNVDIAYMYTIDLSGRETLRSLNGHNFYKAYTRLAAEYNVPETDRHDDQLDATLKAAQQPNFIVPQTVGDDMIYTEYDAEGNKVGQKIDICIEKKVIDPYPQYMKWVEAYKKDKTILERIPAEEFEGFYKFLNEHYQRKPKNVKNIIEAIGLELRKRSGFTEEAMQEAKQLANDVSGIKEAFVNMESSGFPQIIEADPETEPDGHVEADYTNVFNQPVMQVQDEQVIDLSNLSNHPAVKEMDEFFKLFGSKMTTHSKEVDKALALIPGKVAFQFTEAERAIVVAELLKLQ